MADRRSVSKPLPVLVVLAALGLTACGHTIAPDVPFEPGPRYDFAHPPCPPAPAPGETPEAKTPDDAVVIRYLGAGGLFVGWRGSGLLTAPFFSNPGMLRVGLGRMRPDEEAIRRGLDGLPLERIGAILAGHSHYDHLGDLPWVADAVPGATLLVNRSGERALAPYRDRLGERLRILEDRAGRWHRLEDADGRLLPFRVLAVPSDHAPHAAGILIMDGESQVLGREWKKVPYRALRTGRTYAFVIDLLAGVGVEPEPRFRILYQDAASPAPADSLPGRPPDGRAYELAVLCMPSAHLVPPYPERVLARTAPRHALVIHYENFFREWGPGHRFAPLLTGNRADAFLERTAAALDAAPASGGEPLEPVCGPSAPRWTMPLVGEWLVFGLTGSSR